jgi:peptide/nickel transport system permease protein
MARYLLVRIGVTVPLLLAAMLLIFLAGRLAPGDPIAVRLGDAYDPVAARAVRHSLGLDRPLWVQFARYAMGVARLDFGESLVRPGLRVASVVAQTLPISLRLAGLAVAGAALFGVAAGIAGSAGPGTPLDRVLQFGIVLALSLPNFVVAAILVLAFALWLNALPVAGLATWQGYVLPVGVLAVPPTAYISRITRASMLRVLGQEYIRTARGKGVARGRLFLRHALRNALLPIVTTIGLAFGYTLAGSFVVEIVFDIPGMSRAGVEGILQRDYPVLQTVVLTYTALFILVNLLVDLSYALFDPRVHY